MMIKDKSIKDWYGSIMKCYSVGYGMVFGRVYGIINIVLVRSTYFLVKGFNPGFFESLIIGICIVIGLFIGGLIFLRLDLQKAEQRSMFNEQPQLKEMHEKILIMSGQIQSINEYLAIKAKDETNDELPTEYMENGKKMLRLKTSCGWVCFPAKKDL